jgi:hypothetical protein
MKEMVGEREKERQWLKPRVNENGMATNVHLTLLI